MLGRRPAAAVARTAARLRRPGGHGPGDGPDRRRPHRVPRVLDALRAWTSRTALTPEPGSSWSRTRTCPRPRPPGDWSAPRRSRTPAASSWSAATSTATTPARVAAVVAAGEDQCLIRGDRTLVPRVTRRTPVLAEAGGPVRRNGARHRGDRRTRRSDRRAAGRPARCPAPAARLPARPGRRRGRGADRAPVGARRHRRSSKPATSPTAPRWPSLIASIPADRPLIGVVHSAGVLDDATLEGLSPERIEKVFRPKVDAGWLLHELTLDQPLRVFVLFSSIAGVIGNAGQGSLRLPNTFLDALAALRRSLGLPGRLGRMGPVDQGTPAWAPD